MLVTSVMCYACLCCAIQMQRPVSELARCPAQGDQTAFVQEIGHPFMRGGAFLGAYHSLVKLRS